MAPRLQLNELIILFSAERQYLEGRTGHLSTFSHYLARKEIHVLMTLNTEIVMPLEDLHLLSIKFVFDGKRDKLIYTFVRNSKIFIATITIMNFL